MTNLQAPAGTPARGSRQALLAGRVAALPAQRLKGMRRGIEKESLRAQAGGGLALTPHPAALGSALTHPCITTDFSESQVELVTGVHGSVRSRAGRTHAHPPVHLPVDEDHRQ